MLDGVSSERIIVLCVAYLCIIVLGYLALRDKGECVMDELGQEKNWRDRMHDIGDDKRSVRVDSDLPLIEYIEKEQRSWLSTAAGGPEIIVRLTRGLKWIICGEYGGAWVFHVDDETDFRKLATAMYISSKIRRSRFWAWWYRSVRKVALASEGVTSDEWK